MTEKVCPECGRRICLKRPCYFSLRFEGLVFRIFLNGFYKCADVVSKEFLKNFKEYGKEIIFYKNGKIKVNWQLYSEISKSQKSGCYNETRTNAVTEILIALNIFSTSSEGNYQITADGGLGLNPSFCSSCLYFTREEDVIKYAGINFSETLYYWEIRHIGKVIRKNQIKSPA